MQNIRTLPQLLVRIFVRPLFPFFQWAVLTFGIVKAPARQEYLLGFLSTDIDTAYKHLRSQGFFLNRIAFTDPGQVLSMRRLDNTLADWQYHVRIFEDGEIRGHYERTPEDHPFTHLKAIGQEKREEMFRPWLQDIMREV